MSGYAFIFPGQGAQSVGMGQDLANTFPAAKAVFDEVDSALGENFSDLIWNGSEEQLTMTANTQPALMAVSIAVMRTLENEFNVKPADAKFVAGHSLGEYSALAAVGAIKLADAAKLLRLRGEAMQDAVAAGEGAMAALLGADQEQAEALVEIGRKVGACDIANDNAPGQIVISGSKAAIDAACAAAGDVGIKKAVPLAVSAPFHCSLMQPAQEKMQIALADTKIIAPMAPLVANVTARPTEDPETIRKQLVEQVTGRVRWRESVEWMASEEGGALDLTVEAGAGKVLTTMNKRIARSLKGVALNAPADLEAFAKSLDEV
ncbi:ACP S-malonyltransferase [Hirschia litorea]|uniref:Malonyl CoA-acyl carrier protein transacylase n=1 Tax=Hirschia litorea TaxID=1199156 RepID=A0ABW2IGV0_9PROT